jgi:DNA polymerase-3 subunit gamma/tau
MSYVVLARKYRPQSLEDLIGQPHIVTTLQNAIRENRVAQSFLFVGSRGVGKTSTARIIAKILNCQRRGNKDTAPCNTCASCIEITNGTSLDVLEIDGASNRGIDEIRNLRENVKFKPASGIYKVYIIDEVHMLTQEAFNALLKTLEEPPVHVKFIFATTEPHRVLPTIISRCQRYDFRRITTVEIAESLQALAKKEQIKITDEAVFAIAKTAEGGMRDAQSTLDQIANYTNSEITLEIIETMLGFTNEKTYIHIVKAIAEKNTHEALTLIQRVVNEGKDLRDFNKGLLEIFRDIMILKTVAEPVKLIDRLKASIAELKECSDLFLIEEILYCLTLLQNLIGQLRYSTFPQINTELAIVKMTNRADMVALSDLLAQLDTNAGPQKEEKKTNTGVRTNVPQVKVPASQKIETKMKAYLEKPNEQSLEPSVSPAPFAKKERDTPCSFKELEEKWQNIISDVRTLRMSTGTFLSEAEPVELNGTMLILALPSEFKFHKETLESKDNITFVETAIQKVTGAQLRITYVIAEKDTAEIEIKEKQNEKHAQIVESATHIFQGRAVRGS